MKGRTVSSEETRIEEELVEEAMKAYEDAGGCRCKTDRSGGSAI